MLQLLVPGARPSHLSTDPETDCVADDLRSDLAALNFSDSHLPDPSAFDLVPNCHSNLGSNLCSNLGPNLGPNLGSHPAALDLTDIGPSGLSPNLEPDRQSNLGTILDPKLSPNLDSNFGSDPATVDRSADPDTDLSTNSNAHGETDPQHATRLRQVPHRL